MTTDPRIAAVVGVICPAYGGLGGAAQAALNAVVVQALAAADAVDPRTAWIAATQTVLSEVVTMAASIASTIGSTSSSAQAQIGSAPTGG